MKGLVCNVETKDRYAEVYFIMFCFLVSGIPVLSTVGDYYAEVMSHLNANNMDGLLTDDPNFVLLNPPRLFAAHDFKLTYKGSLETKEYLLEKWTQNHQISPDSFPLLGSLLGIYISHFFSQLDGFLSFAGSG